MILFVRFVDAKILDAGSTKIQLNITAFETTTLTLFYDAQFDLSKTQSNCLQAYSPWPTFSRQQKRSQTGPIIAY